MRRAVSILVPTIALATLAVSLASAHHSQAEFDRSKVLSLEGVVTRVKWVNPHMWIYLDVKDENAKTINWGIEGTGSASMANSGITPAILKLGDTVRIKAYGPRVATDHIGSFIELEVNGKTYSRN